MQHRQNNNQRQVMDAPSPGTVRSKNNHIEAAFTKLEDSPVFNFLNSLSPIKPVKSTHITQTINPLCFASLPPVFTSPHVDSHWESRYLQRHKLSDPSKPEFCSDLRTIFDKNNEKMEAAKKLEEQTGNFYYDLDSCGLKVNQMGEYACSSSTLVPFGEEAAQFEHNKEASSCDWDNLFCDASDLIVLESPNDAEFHKKSIDRQRTSVDASAQCETQNGYQVGEESEIIENVDPNGASACPLRNNPSENMDYEHLSSFYRGIRKRCLVFKMGGAGRKKLNENENLGSESNASTSLNDQQLLLPITTNDSSYNVLPGIGLHLNALASTTCKNINNDQASSASRRLLIGPSSSLDFHPAMHDQELLNSTTTFAPPSERESNTVESGVPPVEDSCHGPVYMENDEMNHSSPKKKSRRLEQTVEVESCKRCNCKKSKCLKLYCECFAAGVYCVEPCACTDCFNKPIHEDTVLATRKQIESRNPLAFAPKVIRGSESQSETVADPTKTPSSARHKRGCNCKKSGCLKKYCECYQGGVGCSANCRCEGCKNAFGRKGGSSAIVIYEDKSGATEMSIPDKTAIQNIDLDQKVDSVPPSTPLHSGRLSIHHPFSNRKPPKPSFTSSSGFYTSQIFGNQSFFQLPATFDKRFETLAEDEIPDFLQGSSPIKSLSPISPNKKRVSPPHGLGSSRKLILQSIPSFPSLTPNPH